MTALPSLPLPVPVVATTGRDLCDSPLTTDTGARCSACLAMASVLGCVRRCLSARAAAIFEKTNCFHWCDKEEIRSVGVLGENNVEKFIRRGLQPLMPFEYLFKRATCATKTLLDVPFGPRTVWLDTSLPGWNSFG